MKVIGELNYEGKSYWIGVDKTGCENCDVDCDDITSAICSAQDKTIRGGESTKFLDREKWNKDGSRRQCITIKGHKHDILGADLRGKYYDEDFGIRERRTPFPETKTIGMSTPNRSTDYTPLFDNFIHTVAREAIVPESLLRGEWKETPKPKVYSANSRMDKYKEDFIQHVGYQDSIDEIFLMSDPEHKGNKNIPFSIRARYKNGDEVTAVSKSPLIDLSSITELFDARIKTK